VPGTSFGCRRLPYPLKFTEFHHNTTQSEQNDSCAFSIIENLCFGSVSHFILIESYGIFGYNIGREPAFVYHTDSEVAFVYHTDSEVAFVYHIE